MNKLFKLTLGFLLLFQTLAYAFTVPSAPYDDPPDAYTSLQLSFDEADGSTTTDDESANNFTVTANGNVQTDNAQTKFSNTSVFDGTGDYWTVPDDVDFAFGSGDFTVDLWFRINSATNAFLAAQNGATIADTSFWIRLNYGDTISGVISDGTNLLTVTTPGGLATATWYHAALVRSGNTLTIYRDGSGTNLDITGVSIPDCTKAPAFGVDGNDYSVGFNGWEDEVRISKGIARDWITASGKQFIMITKFINNLNPDKIGTPAWSCKIKLMCMWKNRKYLKG
jgi:hypothetical protein